MGKFINFSIPNRSKRYKGIVAGWNRNGTLDELAFAMVDTSGIIEMEHMKKRIFDRETKSMRDEYTSVISITSEGNFTPNEIRLYGRITRLKVRPFIDNVLQCFACYRFGHMARHCRRVPICVACGDKFHGHCNRDWRCINCGGRHKPTDRRCEVFKYNQEVKRVMAEECVSVYEAKQRLASNHIFERDEWKRVDDRPRFNEEDTIVGRIFEGGMEQGNQGGHEKVQNLIDLEENQGTGAKECFTRMPLEARRTIGGMNSRI